MIISGWVGIIGLCRLPEHIRNQRVKNYSGDANCVVGGHKTFIKDASAVRTKVLFFVEYF